MKKRNTNHAFLVILQLTTALMEARCFTGTNTWKKPSYPLPMSSASTAPDGTRIVSNDFTACDSLISSWEELQTLLDRSKEHDKNAPPPTKPLVTLYRDTNGWCPFCERAWFALEIKQIPYQEQLINLQDKPTWFTQMVPTGLVPAALFHTNEIRERGKNDKEALPASTQPERKLIWESLDILQALDEYFPETPKLVFDNLPAYHKARDVVNKATSAGVQLLYGGRNQTITPEEKQQKRKAFLTALGELDTFLGTQHTDGPFCLGKNVTGLDVEMAPVLERWRYQLPITAYLDIYDKASYPGLYQWYDAMDNYNPYTRRVSGDAYSWTAVASTFLRYFAKGPNGTMTDETNEKIMRADQTAGHLTSTFATAVKYDETIEARQEAAAKLLSNYKAVIADCTNTEPKSQQEVVRASHANAADEVLRAVTQSILTGEAPALATINNKEEAALAARTVAARLCVPRDMGAPAAQILRKSLVTMADQLGSSTV